MSGREPAQDGPLASAIRSRVKGKAAIVGIGNIIRGDDGLGPKLIELMKQGRSPHPLFDCGTAPENYALPILSTSADTVIFVDAADFGSHPGDVRLFDTGDVSQVSFSTHSPSPRLFIDLLRTGKDDLEVFFIAVQPKTTALGQGISAEVMDALARLKEALEEALSAR